MYLIGNRGYLPCPVEDDWDFVLEDENELVSDNADRKADIAPPELGLLKVCERYKTGKYLSTPFGEAKHVSPLGLMLIRRSHLHRPLNFVKNMIRYNYLKTGWESMRDQEYYDLLREITVINKKIYGDKTPSLRKNKKEFFDDYVTKYYDHDDLHYATCYVEKPIYENLKSNSETVWCDKDKWDALSYTDQINCVREECYVIALERYIIPKLKTGQKHMPPGMAFDKALERVCTTLTSGWFRDFAIDNWQQIRQHIVDYLYLFRKRIYEC